MNHYPAYIYIPICIYVIYKYGIYIFHGVCAAIEQLLPARPRKKLKDSAKGLIFPNWFLEAALQLKIIHKVIQHLRFLTEAQKIIVHT